MKELQLGALIKVNDPSQNMENLTGVVLAEDNNVVCFRIIANDYIGLSTHKTNRWNCTVVGRYEGKLN